jgi:hypothetical protein
MTALAPRRSLYAAVIGDLLDLVAAQPHQVLISTASVAIVASEAAYLVPAPFNVLMAVGAEWAYLRGLASSPRGSRGWAMALNWGALALVVLYGMLWGARKFGGIPVELGGALAWLLTAAHILPIAFLSLAAAMVHRSAIEADAADAAQAQAEARERQRRLAAEEDARQAERQRRLDAIEAARLEKLAELESWEAGQAAKQRLKVSSVSPVTAVSPTVTPRPNAERAVLRAAVVTAYRDSATTINVTHAAAALGISRALWYKLKAEAEGEGEL